jgi:hypothetical protein
MAKHENTGQAIAPDVVDVNAIAQALAAPFELTEVKFKPQTVSGNRALAVPFVDARVIQDRLDDVLGVMGWQDSYECLPDGAVVCRLRIRLGKEWITKEDVGGQSEQPDEGDRRKAAFSDALKRAAVKFGIGRYLYRLKPQWVDYDPQKRQIVKPPALPLPAPAVAKTGGSGGPLHPPKTPEPATLKMPEAEKRPGKAKAAEAKASPARNKPATGAELQKRLYEKDAQLASEGVCQPGELVKHIVEAGKKAGYEPDLATWKDAAIDLAINETKVFAAQRSKPRKDVA